MQQFLCNQRILRSFLCLNFINIYYVNKVGTFYLFGSKMLLTLFCNLQTVEEGNDEEFEEMMEQLLERDGGPPHVIADVLETSVDDTHHDSQVCLLIVYVVYIHTIY
jgi:hypothetical protein